MHVLVKKMLMIKFNAVVIDKVLLDALNVKQISITGGLTFV